MANINLIKTDCVKEVNGVWVDFSLGIRLKIARARNSAYRELMNELIEPHRKDIRKDETDIEVINEILKEVRAKTVLLDWENIEDEKGKVISYSSKKALEFFNDPELKDFYTFVIVASENLENFKKDLVKESEKN
jgi:hypothetical protein